jgi:hypothetical protein
LKRVHVSMRVPIKKSFHNTGAGHFSGECVGAL